MPVILPNLTTSCLQTNKTDHTWKLSQKCNCNALLRKSTKYLHGKNIQLYEIISMNRKIYFPILAPLKTEVKILFQTNELELRYLVPSQSDSLIQLSKESKSAPFEELQSVQFSRMNFRQWSILLRQSPAVICVKIALSSFL